MAERSLVDLEDVFQYLQEWKGDATWSANHKASVRRMAKNFICEGSDMYYIKNGGKRLVVFDDEKKKDIFRECHDSPMGGHFGQKKTLGKIESRFYWRSMVTCINNWIKMCDKCQYSEKIRTEAPVLQPIKVVGKWEMVGIDLIGPLPLSENGNRYVLTMSDYYTKWTETYPIPSKDAASVAKVLSSIFYRMGAPEKLLTDQGSEFCNELVDDLLKEWGIKHKITAAYHPQTNGLDERFNQTLKASLSKVISERQDDWERYLEPVTFAYRIAPHCATGYSPFFLMFHREARLPCELVDTEKEMTMPSKEDYNVHMESQHQELTELHSKYMEKVEKAQAKYKKQYEAKKGKNVVVFHFEKGMKVLKKNFHKVGRKGAKLETDWIGPYRVKSIDQRQNVTLETLEGKELKTKVAYIHLKPYREVQAQAGQEDPVRTENPSAQATADQEDSGVRAEDPTAEPRADQEPVRTEDTGAGAEDTGDRTEEDDCKALNGEGRADLRQTPKLDRM